MARGGGDFLIAAAAVAGGDFLQVVDVVEVDVGQPADGRFDVVDGDVDHHNRPVTPRLSNPLKRLSVISSSAA